MKEAITSQKRHIGEHNENIVNIVNYAKYIWFIFFLCFDYDQTL